MTRDLAINILTEHIRLMGDEPSLEEDREAFEFAISALKMMPLIEKFKELEDTDKVARLLAMALEPCDVTAEEYSKYDKFIGEPCETSTDEPMTMVYPTIFCDDAVSREDVRQGMLKYGFTAPDMTVHEFVEDELPSVQPKASLIEFEQFARERGLTIMTVEEAIKLRNSVPSRKGHWDKIPNYGKWKCSECGTEFRFTFKEHNFCPNCGAEMVETKTKSR